MFKIGDLKLLIDQLRKNPLETVCGLLIAAVLSLWWTTQEQAKADKAEIEKNRITIAKNQEKIERLQAQNATIERSWSSKLDTVRQQQIQELRDALERQDRIERDQKRLLKRVK